MIKVLITEDSPVVRGYLKYILGSDPDIQVVGTAQDGEEAVRMVEIHKPDVVTMDIHMPKMDGFELIKQLRSRLETAVIPIIMLTARQDKDSELKGIDAGADDYIVKPFDIDKLLSRIKMLLRRK
jgi:two-component system chemotaxis response regulator CheB